MDAGVKNIKDLKALTLLKVSTYLNLQHPKILHLLKIEEIDLILYFVSIEHRELIFFAKLKSNIGLATC
jgi:hypothetical protein